MRFPAILTISLAAAALAGCAEPDRYHHGGLAEDYQYGEFDHVASRRDIRLSVIGYPFAMPENRHAFPRIVETWMWGKNQGPEAHFTANPGPSHRVPYNVIMVFNPHHAMSPRELCRATPETTTIMAPNAEGQIAIQAAFCRGDKPLSVSSSAKRGITSPLDEAFGVLISDTAYILFPRPDAYFGPDSARNREPDFGTLNH